MPSNVVFCSCNKYLLAIFMLIFGLVDFFEGRLLIPYSMFSKVEELSALDPSFFFQGSIHIITHKSCFKESTHPKCEVCFRFVILVFLCLLKLLWFKVIKF
jgi:hypothetical protein